MSEDLDYSRIDPSVMITEYNTVGSPQKFLKGVKFSTYAYLPEPTDTDYERGYIKRYFTRQVNHAHIEEIMEISKAQYDKLQNIPLFVTAEILWKISGPLQSVAPITPLDNLPEHMYIGVEQSNRMSIAHGNDLLPGLSKKLTNILEYYRST